MLVLPPRRLPLGMGAGAVSRKDYIRAARIIVLVADVEIRQYLAREFADMFAEDNRHFDRHRFMHAAGAEVLTR